jgi:S-adenosylmethionine uptake transporter
MHQRPLIPFLVACAGIGSFSLMDALMKGLVLQIDVYNALFWRQLAAIAMLVLPYFILRRRRRPTRAAIRMHAHRAAVVLPMGLTFFWALGRLPLAEAIALSFIAPVIALYLAALLLGETIGRSAIWASLLGLIGVGVIVSGRLRGAYDPGALWAAGAVLVSACLFAYNLILARRQAQIAGAMEIALFMGLFLAGYYGLAAPFLATPPAAEHWPAILGAAALSSLSLLLLSWAYARAEAQALIPVEYTGFLWAILFGWLFFAERPGLPVLAGAGLIVAGSFIAARAKPKLVQAVDLDAV